MLVTDDTHHRDRAAHAADDAEVVDAAGLHRHSRPDQRPHAHLADGVARRGRQLDAARVLPEDACRAWPPCSQPDDLHIATLVGALNQLNCGTTTLADWCHNNRTPAHNDAAIAGLLESGIRAAFFHGTPKPDPKPGETPFWEVPHPRAEVERLLQGAPGQPRC